MAKEILYLSIYSSNCGLLFKIFHPIMKAVPAKTLLTKLNNIYGSVYFAAISFKPTPVYGYFVNGVNKPKDKLGSNMRVMNNQHENKPTNNHRILLWITAEITIKGASQINHWGW